MIYTHGEGKEEERQIEKVCRNDDDDDDNDDHDTDNERTQTHTQITTTFVQKKVSP